jgi:antitoxin YefM
MSTVLLENALQNFPDLMKNVLMNNDETLIVSNFGSVMMISESDWNEIQETLHLLKDKRSLAALLESHKLRDQNHKIKSKSIEETFYDIQD